MKSNNRFTPRCPALVLLAGVVEVSIKAEAMTSDVPCGNEIVNVPVRGRIDLVKKPLRVKVGFKRQQQQQRNKLILTHMILMFINLSPIFCPPG